MKPTSEAAARLETLDSTYAQAAIFKKVYEAKRRRKVVLLSKRTKGVSPFDSFASPHLCEPILTRSQTKSMPAPHFVKFFRASLMSKDASIESPLIRELA